MTQEQVVALVRLIADLYAQVSAQQQRIAELEQREAES